MARKKRNLSGISRRPRLKSRRPCQVCGDTKGRHRSCPEWTPCECMKATCNLCREPSWSFKHQGKWLRGGSTREEAADFRQELLDNLRLVKQGAKLAEPDAEDGSTGTTVTELIDLFKAQVYGDYSDGHQEAMDYAFRYGLQVIDGERAVTSLKRADYIDLLTHLKRQPTLGPSSVIKYFGTWRKLLEVARDREIVEVSVAEGRFKLPTPNGRRLRWLRKDEIRALITAADATVLRGANRYRESAPEPHPWFGVFVRVLLFAGLRNGEALKLKWDTNADHNINLRERTLTCYAQKGKGAKRRYRTIPLTDEVYSALVALREQQFAAGHEDGWVFPSTLNPKKAATYPKRAFNGAVRRAGLADTGVTIHTLRHTCATQLFLAGADIYRVCQYLGHQDIETTRIYLHLSAEHLREAATLLDDAFASVAAG